MTSPQEDAELRDRIGLWKWGGDFHRYIYGDSLGGPSERAIIQLDEIMSLIKARDEQREPSRAEKINTTAELLVEWAKQEEPEHITDLSRFKSWLKYTLTNPQEQDKETTGSA